MSADLGYEQRILTQDGLWEALHRVQEGLHKRHGNLGELDLQVILGAALLEGFKLAGGFPEIYKGSLLGLEPVDEYGVGTIFVRDSTSHLDIEGIDGDEIENDDSLAEPTDDELFGDIDVSDIDVDALPDAPRNQEEFRKMQEDVERGYN